GRMLPGEPAPCCHFEVQRLIILVIYYAGIELNIFGSIRLGFKRYIACLLADHGAKTTRHSIGNGGGGNTGLSQHLLMQSISSFSRDRDDHDLLSLKAKIFLLHMIKLLVYNCSADDKSNGNNKLHHNQAFAQPRSRASPLTVAPQNAQGLKSREVQRRITPGQEPYRKSSDTQKHKPPSTRISEAQLHSKKLAKYGKGQLGCGQR